METLKLDKSTAMKLYKSSPDWFQSVLRKSFGDACFSGKIIDRIKSLEDAIAEANDKTRLECTIFESDTPDVVAYKKLKLIIKVINEDFVPDFTNQSQQKWYPWFKVGSSGSGFDLSYAGYYYDYSYAIVGSRLCFETKEKCQYVAEQFRDLYEQFLLTK
jgi:hypothetical protein